MHTLAFTGAAGRGMGEPGEAPHSPSPPAGKGRGEGAPGPRHSRESGTPDRPIVAVDPRYFRPTEVETLLGDAAKAKEKLGWTPKIRFQELVAEMVREDLKSAERDELVKKHGYAAFDYNE